MAYLVQTGSVLLTTGLPELAADAALVAAVFAALAVALTTPLSVSLATITALAVAVLLLCCPVSVPTALQPLLTVLTDIPGGSVAPATS